MRYITGIHALNLSCNLETCGDWHTSALRWRDISFKNTGESIYGEWGIEYDCVIPEHSGTFPVANHIRALLDLLEDGKFSVAQGMREDFICNEKYTPLVFEKVWELREVPHWTAVDEFMKRGYRLDWLTFKEAVGGYG